MKGTILLNYNENTRQIEEEEKSNFLRCFLDQCFESAPNVANQISTIWNVDGPLPADQKVKLRNVLTTYGIQVIDDLDGHMKIYLENEVQAEWFKSTYKIKKDLSAIDPKKRIFLEMNISCWSVFDPAEEQETA
jgi:hypothetical protein